MILVTLMYNSFLALEPLEEHVGALGVRRGLRGA